MIVVNRDFWLNKVGEEMVQDLQQAEKETNSFVLFRYLGLKVDGSIGNKPRSEDAKVRNYSYMHYADLVCTGVTAKSIYALLDVVVNLGKENLEFLREDLEGIIMKNNFWKEALG